MLQNGPVAIFDAILCKVKSPKRRRAPTTKNGTVPPRRVENAKRRPREYLTVKEVDNRDIAMPSGLPFGPLFFRPAAAALTLTSGPETPLVLRADAAAKLLLQTVIVPGARTDEGKLIEAVALPWFDIVSLLSKDPSVAYEISPEKWEEIVAGAYHKAGFDEVILTPRSGDHGRDVIAIKKGLGSVRVIDQVKAFKPPHLVAANDVRALMGVLQGDGASKGFLTTTSDFAPKLRADPLIIPFMPARLELINGPMLIARLEELARIQPTGNPAA
jgi:restriction system protein